MPVINPSVSPNADYDILTVDVLLKTDDIEERTAGSGVTIDGVLLKDSDVTADEIFTNAISEKTANNGILLDGTILVKDSIIQNTGGTFIIRTNGSGQDIKVRCNDDIYIQPGIAPGSDTSAFIFDSGGDLIAQGNTKKIRSSGNYLYLDSPVRITNLASDPGSTAAGTIYYNTGTTKMHFRNGSAFEEILSGLSITVDDVSADDVFTDTISELSAGVGVTVDGVLLKDSDVTADEVFTDVISEASAAAGVTIDGQLIKDGNIVRTTVTAYVPTLRGNGNNNVFTCSTAESVYTTIADVVFFQAKFTITSTNSATGNVVMTLPFEATPGSTLAVIYCTNFDVVGSAEAFNMAGRCTSASSDMGFVGSITSAAGFNIVPGDISPTAELWVGGSYIRT